MHTYVCTLSEVVRTIFFSDEDLLSYNHGSRFLTVGFEPGKISMEPLTGRVYHPGPQKTGGIGLLSDKLALAWTAVSKFSHQTVQNSSKNWSASYGTSLGLH